jgi:hypothetical protein
MFISRFLNTLLETQRIDHDKRKSIGSISCLEKYVILGDEHPYYGGQSN